MMEAFFSLSEGKKRRRMPAGGRERESSEGDEKGASFSPS
jgi:hypothetical protein